MMKFLRNLPYPPLLIAAIFLGLAPFSPAPHALEKFIMLLDGSLQRPLDIFDLLFHLAPTLMLMLKFVAERRGKDRSGKERGVNRESRSAKRP